RRGERRARRAELDRGEEAAQDERLDLVASHFDALGSSYERRARAGHGEAHRFGRVRGEEGLLGGAALLHEAEKARRVELAAFGHQAPLEVMGEGEVEV